MFPKFKESFKKKVSLSYPKIIVILLFFFLIFIGTESLDPDLGWHLRMGKIILSSGIPATDPLSYTMPSFAFVDHEWLTNVLLASLYPLLGKIGLAVIYSFLAVAALLISLKSFKLKSPLLSSALLLLAAGTIMPFFGVRPQVASWFLLAILLKVLLNRKLYQRFYFLLPFYFLFWANLHGSFSLGIFTLFFLLFLKVFKERKIYFKDILVGVLSFVFTLISPYGIRLWGEVFMQLTDHSLRWTIIEWLPAIFTVNLPFLALMSLSALMVYHFRKRYSLEKIALFSAFLLGALSSQRHVPLWVMATLPILSEGFSFLSEEVRAYKEGPLRMQKVIVFLFLGSLIISLIPVFSFFTQPSKEEYFYPKKAVEYLKNNLPAGQIFSSYNWGGYLVWKLPEKRVFIDGRMPSWRWEKKLPQESSYAMKDYEKILKGEESFSQTKEKYDVEVVLWPVSGRVSLLDSLGFWLEKFLSKDKEFNFTRELTQEGWQEVYKDEVAIIYQKP